ncbi:MAG: SAM-dependent methyltransferase [Actinobacteria bacterium]|nr:SAM-dependent methyltransferase [Actinomycetota bacterium]
MPSGPSTPLLQKIQGRIRAEGPLTFDRFMQLALYDPAHGYYCSRVPGKGSHYQTSATAGPWFGRFVTVELQRMWDALGRPSLFTVVEAGAGLAELAKQAFAYAGEMGGALRWCFIERFETVKQMQQEALGPAARYAEWATCLEGLPVEGCVLANEVLDNFPVHLLEQTFDGVREVCVDIAGDRLRTVLRPPGPGLVDQSVLEAAEYLEPGDRFEVCPDIVDWCRGAARAIDRGYLLVIDYGDEQPDIWRRGPQGTITTYGPRRLSCDLLEDAGAKDITADVDFSALWSAAQGAGFDMELLALQRFWLVSLGLPVVVENLTDRVKQSAALGRHEEAADLDEELRQVLALADPDGLGGCLVFRASKGFEA